jgi:hypothetical protein
MGTALEGELRSLLAYYGENPDSPDAPKPEDFFGLVASFSSSLQAGVCIHVFAANSITITSRNVPSRFMMQKRSAKYQYPRRQRNLPKHPFKKTLVSFSRWSSFMLTAEPQTIKAKATPTPQSRQSLMPRPANSQGYAAGNRSVSRGDFDLTIRSMRDGKRRARPQASRPLSRIFLDGSGGNTGRPQSRLFE